MKLHRIAHRIQQRYTNIFTHTKKNIYVCDPNISLYFVNFFVLVIHYNIGRLYPSHFFKSNKFPYLSHIDLNDYFYIKKENMLSNAKATIYFHPIALRQFY